MSWPCREDLFGPLMDDARAEWAEVARGIGRFEPVTVVVDPAQEAEARRLLGPDVDVLVMPLDDSWIRDNGPIFVRDADGRVAAVQFRFDGWNEQFTPYDKDAEGPARIAEAWGARLYQAPFTLEGGAFNTDGEGTLLTTEQCLLHNRNLGCSRGDNEALLSDWLGIDKVIWLPYGLVEDSGPFSTSGHVDDVAQFIAPGVVVAQTAPVGNANHTRLQENLEVLKAATDAAGRKLEVIELELLPYVQGVGAGLDGVAGPGAGKLMPAPYVNMVFVEGAVLLPRTGVEGEAEALRAARRARRPRAGRPAVRALRLRRRRARLHHAAGAGRRLRPAGAGVARLAYSPRGTDSPALAPGQGHGPLSQE